MDYERIMIAKRWDKVYPFWRNLYVYSQLPYEEQKQRKLDLMVRIISMKEADVVIQVKEVLKVAGLPIQHITTGVFKTLGPNPHYVRSCAKGTLDFEGYDNHGRFVGIECKRPTGWRLSKEQKKRIDDINAKGGVAFITRSGEETIRLLKENGCL